jgi:hypothetical protein
MAALLDGVAQLLVVPRQVTNSAPAPLRLTARVRADRG